MFEGFTLDRIDVGDVDPAGAPRRHRVRRWCCCTGTPARTPPGTASRRCSPRDHTVVCPDLRGYGSRPNPTSRGDEAAYSKRAMAADVVGADAALGHERFAVVGHDRGSYVAYRTALDHPDRVTRLAVLDGMPIVEALERCDARFAAAWWHWFFLGQRAKPAERVINADPETWYSRRTTNTAEGLGADNHADFLAAIRNPATVLGMCEDYRAGLGHDRRHDAADRAAGRRVELPDADAVVVPRRPRGPVRRPARGLATVVPAGRRPRHRLHPSHRRTGSRRTDRQPSFISLRVTLGGARCGGLPCTRITPEMWVLWCLNLPGADIVFA